MSFLTHRSLGCLRGVSPETFDSSLPEIVEGALFHENLTCYAIVDAARVQLLIERLEAEGLNATCLYDGDEALMATAPWLIELTPNANFTKMLFHSNLSGDNPFALFDLDAAVFLHSTEALDELRGWLRRYTALPDEIGTRRFLRLAQPGYLATLLLTSPSGAGFFKKVSKHFYMLPTLTEGGRELWSLEANEEATKSTTVPVIDQSVRGAFHALRNDLSARALARSDGGEMPLRIRRRDIYFKAMQAGFDAPETLRRTDRILSKISPEEQHRFWSAAAEGSWSLGYLCQQMARRHGIKEDFIL